MWCTYSFLGDILKSDTQLHGGLFSEYKYDVNANQNYDENNQISQNAELPDGWRGDKSADSEDYEWQWIGIW